MAKKKEKNYDNMDSQEDYSERRGSKIVNFLIALIVVLIWLAIFAVLIKQDFNGIGSKVLRPILKDVPIINRILPDSTDEEFFSENDYPYTNLESAVARIKELELQLQDLQSQSGADSEYVSDLKAEVERLQVFEKNQADFEARVKEFDEKVVFADEAPDIEEYQAFYEQIDPENAEEIYRQVIEQIQYDERVQEQADRYAKMDPADAAAVLEIMSAGDLDLVCGILSSMKSQQSALIMAQLDPATTAKITKKISLQE
ncbi:MotE family protein [Anaeromicropila populeti]|uniref:Flagellar motility protein MotE, a chaperone for MotC folding n=1 Tax=Anaeromicropila populeti TaxID=37658 RepID=A0A1I6KY32_9FIRM|nr:hypothetical protein [Anaeromicropila populeti]SFR95840.1 hypothetical protein SAMN05661086_02827 [Anaeromicropila populeti]